ncbi:MAG: twin-arginine translocation signal domain-containing protein, partial [Chitinophagaceae bacterium]|nr:twin-arginine translocation signal domain-containing protein [Chitinophagaceae bacterium]
MKNKRRDFLKLTGLAGLTMAGGALNGFASATDNDKTALRQPFSSKDFTDSPFKMTDQIKEAFDRG